MILQKTKVSRTPRPTAVAKILELDELFFPCFLAFVKSKKKEKKNQRKSSTLKLAVVNNNKF